MTSGRRATRASPLQTEWGLIFASVTVSALPVVIAYLLLSRQSTDPD
jgi:ABC-type glycerol-3-phosphate transport system permease component